MMNKEKAAKLIPIMQAYVDGKEIEFQTVFGTWITLDDPNFYADSKYRIKPREIKVYIYETPEGFLFPSESMALNYRLIKEVTIEV